MEAEKPTLRFQFAQFYEVLCFSNGTKRKKKIFR